MDGQPARTPEDRARLAERAMGVVNEHPDANVRKLYAGQVAAEVGLQVSDLVRIADQRARRPTVNVAPVRRTAVRENAEFVAVALLAQDWESIAGWLVEELFWDEAHRRAFLALAASEGDLTAAIEAADPEAREVLERAAVADLDVDAETEARNLIAAAVRRELARRTGNGDPDLIRDDAEARLHLEELGSTHRVSGGCGVVARLAPSSDGGTRQWGTLTVAQRSQASEPAANGTVAAPGDGRCRRVRVGVADRAGPPAGQHPRRAGHPRAAPRRADRATCWPRST